MLERVWRKGNPLTLLVGMQTRTATMDNSGQAPQASSAFRTPTAGYLQSMDKRVTPRLLWRNGFPLAFRVVHGVTGHLLS